MIRADVRSWYQEQTWQVAAVAADPALTDLVANLSLALPVPALTPVAWWAEVLRTGVPDIYQRIRERKFPPPVQCSAAGRTLFSTIAVLRHLATSEVVLMSA